MDGVGVKVQEVREGDVFRDADGEPVWTAVSDALSLRDGTTRIEVQFAFDGGCDIRVWDTGAEITVTRKEVAA